MNKSFYYFILLICCLLPLPIDAANTLTEVIQRTLSTNPDVLITVHNRWAADERVHQAQAGYLPSIELSAGYGRESSDNPSRYSDSSVDLMRQELGLTLSQILFDGFAVKNDTEKQQSKVESAAYQTYETSENIAMRTIEVYLEILRRQEVLELSKDNVVILQDIQKQIQEIFQGGAGRRADVQQSSSRIALAESYLVNAQGLLRDAETEYLRVTGEEATGLQPPDTSTFESTLPISVELAFDTTLNKHPALKVAKAELEAAQAAHEQTNANFLPRFNLEIGVNKNKNIEGIAGDNDDVSAMVRMRYNLYQGGSHQARRQETAELVETAKETIRRTRRILEEELRRAWNSLLTVRARLVYLQQHVTATTQVVESYKEQFKLGQRSLLDVLDSENELFNAKVSLVTAQYTETLSIYRLLNTMGLLLDTLKIKRPAAAEN